MGLQVLKVQWVDGSAYDFLPSQLDLWWRRVTRASLPESDGDRRIVHPRVNALLTRLVQAFILAAMRNIIVAVVLSGRS